MIKVQILVSLQKICMFLLAKVDYIYDTPRLIKSTHNMLFKHNFQINNSIIIAKDHLIAFYNYDSKCNLRLAPKLTHAAHIYPFFFSFLSLAGLSTTVFKISGVSVNLLYSFSSTVADVISAKVLKIQCIAVHKNYVQYQIL